MQAGRVFRSGTRCVFCWFFVVFVVAVIEPSWQFYVILEIKNSRAHLLSPVIFKQGAVCCSIEMTFDPFRASTSSCQIGPLWRSWE